MEDKMKPNPKPVDSAIDIEVASPPHTESRIVSELRNMLIFRHEPPLLLESAGKESCCIFRIPDSFAEVIPNAYTPKVVSIGPYHYGEKHLQMIEQHKIRFLQLFIDKARKNGVEEEVFFVVVEGLEEKIRKSYSEELRTPYYELVPFMILDGCFILMLLLVLSRNIKLDDEKDPIFALPWILPSIQSDLLLLENQVPFFLLQTLFKESKISGDLNKMVFSFFNLSISRPERYWVKHRDLGAKHLLDLIRMTFIPNMRSVGKCEAKSSDSQLYKGESVKIPSSDSTLSFGKRYRHTAIRLFRMTFIRNMISMGESETIPSSDSQLYKGESGKIPSSDSMSSLILPAKRLRLQGIKFRLRGDADSILDIRLKKNRLEIPLLRLDGVISSILLNCAAFEQFYADSTNDITSYVVFMGCLLNSEEDATFLSNDKRIIENYFGDQNEVTQFFKTICKDVVFDIRTSYLKDVFEGVNEYTSKWYNGVWAGFRHTHFESPWTCLSSFAVVFVILLTMLQATVAILSFLNDKKDNGKAAPP